MLTGLSVSLALVGSAVGALIAGPLADRYGRVKMMVLAAIMFSLSALGSGLPFTVWDFIFWRTLGGVGVGIASVIAPAYIAEVAPARLRGRLGSLQQLAIVVGIFIALLSNFLIASLAGSAANPWLFNISAWRWMFWSEIPAAILYGVAALRIPESPRYLVAQGRDQEAADVLQKVEGGDVWDTVANIKGFSWGPVVWVLLGEIFSNKIRGAALSLAAAMQWIANFVVSTTFPPLLSTVGLGAAYGLYTTAAAISIFFVLFFIKETKGKTLEQM